MACLLQPECNFLHGYSRCKLPVEVVDVEVKITSMQGTHIFRQDWTTQLIKCTPWNTRLCPHPPIIKKMKTFLEVEGKMGPIPASQFRPTLPDTNPNIRKDNAAEKRKRAEHKRFRPSAAPKPTAAQPPATVSQAPAKPKIDAPENRPPPLENVPIPESTPWPGTGKVSGNLFEDRNWLLPPNYLYNENKNEHKNVTNITGPRTPVKAEESKVNEQSAEKCRWGPDCPFYKNQEKEKEENKIQKQKMPPQPKVQKPQVRRPKTLNSTDRYPSQTKAKQQWKAEMERLNSKYNLDCFSESELDSESDKGEQYRYEHGYETLI